MTTKTTNALDIDTPLNLADLREGFRHNYGFPVGNIVFALCNRIAELQGWDLDAELPGVEERRAALRAAAEAVFVAHEKEEADRRLKRYIKKHGRLPPTHDEERVRRTEVLARISPEDRKTLGL